MKIQQSLFVLLLVCNVHATDIDQDAIAIEELKQRIYQTIELNKSLIPKNGYGRAVEDRELGKALFDYKTYESEEALALLNEVLTSESNPIHVSVVVSRIEMTDQTLPILLDFANKSSSPDVSVALRRLASSPLILTIDTKMQHDIKATFDRFTADNRMGSELWLKATKANQSYLENIKHASQSNTRAQLNHHIDQVVDIKSSASASQLSASPATSELDTPVKVAPIEVTEVTIKQPTNWLLWLICALIALGGLALVVRRKN